MKKVILLAFATLIMVGCEKRQIVTHKYEVLLSTKDTIYVDCWYYTVYSSTFSSKRIAKFYDTTHKGIAIINDPIYIREIK